MESTVAGSFCEAAREIVIGSVAEGGGRSAKTRMHTYRTLAGQVIDVLSSVVGTWVVYKSVVGGGRA